jgi:hypothetical protein
VSGYDLNPDYDYKANWSRRDRENPRLSGKDFDESWNNFTHSLACASAHPSYEKLSEREALEEVFTHELYHMVQENLYGFGDLAMENKIDKEKAINDSIDEHRDERKNWAMLHIQCDTPWHKNNAIAWYHNNKAFIDKYFGVDVDIEQLFVEFNKKEIARVEAYCAHEDAWIKASNGWRGD